MRAVVQRVLNASVSVQGQATAQVERGLLVLLGVGNSDTRAEAERLAAKIATLRVFEDTGGKMNLSLQESGGEVLCVSQFTLYADVRRGNRPSFDAAAPRATAEPLYEFFCDTLEAAGVVCRRGVFGAEMLVTLENDGPVTLIIDTDDLDTPRRA